MFAVDPSQASSEAASSGSKRNVTFEEDLAPGENATLKEKISHAIQKSPLGDPVRSD